MLKSQNMKHQLNVLIAIAVILLGLTACQKSTKEMLIGTWYVSKTIIQDEGEGTIEGTETICKDGTYSEIYNATFTIEMDIEGYTVCGKIGMSIKCTGDWTLHDKEIVSSPTSVGVKATSFKLYDPSSGEFLAESTDQELSLMTNEIVEEMKSALMDASTERIIMIQDDKFITEAEEDGAKTTYTYHRIK